MDDAASPSPIAVTTAAEDSGAASGALATTKGPRNGTSPTSALPRRPSTVEGRFFHMEFSPLRNPRSMSTISSSGVPKPRNTVTDGLGSNTAAESAAVAYGNAAAVKVRHLQDFLNNYPVHEHGGSRTAASGMLGSTGAGDDEDIPALMGTKRGGAASTLRGATSTVGGATVNFLNNTTAGSSAGGAIGGGGVSSSNKDAATNAARRQKMDAWLSVADKGNKKLRSENDVLEKLALMAQENSLDNDAKYEEAIATLRNQLEFAQTFRQDTSHAVQSMDDRMEGIRDLISELVTTAERRCHQEHEAVHSAFRKQLEQQRSELDRVREKGKNTTHDWKTKNMALQEQLEAVMHLTQSTYERLSALQADSQRLRVEFSAQAGDADILQSEYRRVYTEHQRLKDRLYTLETEMSKATVRPSVTPAVGGSGNGGRPGSRSAAVASKLEGELKEESERARGFSRNGYRGSPDGEVSGSATRDRDYDAALRKVQIMFETEAANLKAVREGHLHTLRQRTELEVFLRQLIIKRKGEKSRLSEGEQDALGKSGASARVAAMAKDRHGSSGGSRGGRRDHSASAGDNATGAQVLCTLEGAPVAFTVDDRKESIDQLLSMPRVLELLFGDGMASSAVDNGVEDMSLAMRRVDSVQKPSVHEERELVALYDTWKQWTERANKETYVAIPQLAGVGGRAATR